jgi:hypothetical protein
MKGMEAIAWMRGERREEEARRGPKANGLADIKRLDITKKKNSMEMVKDMSRTFDPRVFITKRKINAFEEAVKSTCGTEAGQVVMDTFRNIFPAANARIAKRKYQQLACSLQNLVPTHFEMALSAFKNAFGFDPDYSTYTKELGQRMYARLKTRCEETGQTIYSIQQPFLFRSLLAHENKSFTKIQMLISVSKL